MSATGGVADDELKEQGGGVTEQLRLFRPPVPLFGEPGYLDVLEAAFLCGHITERELGELLVLELLRQLAKLREAP